MSYIQRRQVFYLSGFDPRGASFYHRIFKEEALKQSKVNGIKVKVKARKKQAKFSQKWEVEAEDQGQQIITQYEFLCWDDIVRQNWIKSFWSIFIDFIYVSWVYITTGTLLRVAKSSPTPTITGLYPAIFILSSGLLAILSFYACVVFFSVFNLMWLGCLFGLIVFVVIVYISKLLGDRVNVFWLLRTYAFTSRWAEGKIPSLDQRLDLFAEQIFEVLQRNKQDEVIIIGHSVGTMLSVAIVAQIIRKIDNDQMNHSINMITLGECIPLLSLLPKATAIRKDLACLSSTKYLYWVDYTSPVDGACFPLVDPVKVSLPKQLFYSGPLLLSTRFHKLLDPIYYKKIRRNFYKMHFLYLMSHNKQGEYDFFAMTLGKQSLKKRIEEQGRTS